MTVNVRIMAATNRDLSRAVSRGEFRRDLFFRLNVYGIRVPPLRERLADIPVLTRQIVGQMASELRLTAGLSIRPEDMEKLIQYSWPGNVRELKNVLERSVILSEGPDLRLDFLDLTETNHCESPWVVSFLIPVHDLGRGGIETPVYRNGPCNGLAVINVLPHVFSGSPDIRSSAR